MIIRPGPVRGLLLTCLAFGLSAAVASLAAEDGAAGDTEPVEQCVRDNLPDDSSVQTIVLTSTDRVGAETRLGAKIFWQKDKKGHSKALLQFSDPPEMRDSSLLVLEREGDNDMFMYLPELGRVRRVTTHMMSGSMFGTDFSYEDFERLQGMADDLSTERLADSDVDGRKTFVVSAVPAAEGGSDYEKVISYIDQEMCVPIKIEFFEKGEKLRKRMETDVAKVKNEGGIHVPTAVSMTDLREDTTTRLLVEEIDLHAKIPRKMFSQSQLEKRN